MPNDLSRTPSFHEKRVVLIQMQGGFYGGTYLTVDHTLSFCTLLSLANTTSFS